MPGKQWLLIGLYILWLSACGGGGGGSSLPADNADDDTLPPGSVSPANVVPVDLRVLEIEPALSSGLIKVDSVFKIRFSTSVEPASVVAETVRLVALPSGVAVDAQLEYKANPPQITLSPKLALQHGALYRLDLSDTITSLQKSRITGDRSWSFETEPAAQLASCPQSSIKIAPADRAKHIAPGRSARVWFGEPISAVSLSQTPAAITLLNESGEIVPVELRVDHADCRVDVTPREPLRYNGAYIVSVRPSLLKNTANAPIAGSDISHTFTTIDKRLLGASYFNGGFSQMALLQEQDLLGVLRFGGRWVTEFALPEKNPGVVVPGTFIEKMHQFCDYAVARNQLAWIQIPVLMDNAGISGILDAIDGRPDRCNLLLFAIGNEVDRFDHHEEQYATNYHWPDYLAALDRIVPLLQSRFPDTALVGLDLSSFEDYWNYAAVRDWIVPFCASSSAAVKAIDFLSIHLYQFNGSQKYWDMVLLGDMFANHLAQLPASCPDILLGEFNVTYQWQADSTYPTSGGDSFPSVIALPEVMHQKKVVGLLQWSLLEGETSTIGLYRNSDLSPKPLYWGYRMLAPTLSADAQVSTSGRLGVVSRAFQARGGRQHVYLANRDPVFRRNVSLGTGSGADVRLSGSAGQYAGVVQTLPPLSLTHLEIDPTGGIVLAEQVNDRTPSLSPVGYDTAANAVHCTVLADFTEPNKTADVYVGPGYNENLKIASGNPPSPVFAPAVYASTNNLAEVESGGYLAVRCDGGMLANQPARTLCGVSLPLYSEKASSDWRHKDWSEGLATASLRVTARMADGTATTRMRAELIDDTPNTPEQNLYFHRVEFEAVASAPTTFDLPWSNFVQPSDTPTGARFELAQALSRLKQLRMVLDDPSLSRTFHLHRVEICDRYAGGNLE